MAYTTLEQVKIRLKQFHIDDSSGSDVTVFDRKEENPLIEQLIEQAQEEIKKLRNYPSSYTEEQVYEDLKAHENIVVNLAVYDYSQAGEAYMSSYTENGVSRRWKQREELLSCVFPFIKVL